MAPKNRISRVSEKHSEIQKTLQTVVGKQKEKSKKCKKTKTTSIKINVNCSSSGTSGEPTTPEYNMNLPITKNGVQVEKLYCASEYQRPREARQMTLEERRDMLLFQIELLDRRQQKHQK